MANDVNFEFDLCKFSILNWRFHPLAKGSRQSADQDRKVQEKLRAAGVIPKHIAIIMDGNGRWAKKRAKPRISGHKEGVESVRDAVEACGELGVEFLTLYAFSTENWKRPQKEVSLLMRLLLRALRDETDRLHSNNVRLRAIGEISTLPQEVQSELLESIQKTGANTGLTLVLALSYSGRWDITEAARKIAQEIEAKRLLPAEITDERIATFLSTEGIPDPDLMIRTSGEFSALAACVLRDSHHVEILARLPSRGSLHGDWRISEAGAPFRHGQRTITRIAGWRQHLPPHHQECDRTVT
jgi:undecaprenyl diphosphate synthase